jgi:hypothetical protein
LTTKKLPEIRCVLFVEALSYCERRANIGNTHDVADGGFQDG